MPSGSYSGYYPAPPQQAIPANAGPDEHSTSAPPPPPQHPSSQAPLPASSTHAPPPSAHPPPPVPSPVSTAPIPITESPQQVVVKPTNFEQFETINKDASPETDDQESNEYSAPPTEEPASGSSEFSGLVSYFSSQQDDLDT